jgi:hypothetical protein
MRSVIPLVIVALGIVIGTSLAIAAETNSGGTTATSSYRENRIRHADERRSLPGSTTSNQHVAAETEPGV